MKKIILVNEKDKIIGKGDKLKCHQENGILHRAFTIFIFNKKGEILIQKRSKDKMLWPNTWETSCSSHPKPNEDLIKTAKKRLKKELGFNCNLKYKDKFRYRANYKDIGAENEICWILVGEYSGIIAPNKDEVVEIKWLEPEILEQKIKRYPQKHAPWLKIALQKLLK